MALLPRTRRPVTGAPEPTDPDPVWQVLDRAPVAILCLDAHLCVIRANRVLEQWNLGPVEAAVCALSIHHGVLPVNANHENPDPDCDLNLVVGAARRQPVRVALSNSLGFGGSNSCLAFRHPDFDGGRR